MTEKKIKKNKAEPTKSCRLCRKIQNRVILFYERKQSFVQISYPNPIKCSLQKCCACAKCVRAYLRCCFAFNARWEYTQPPPNARRTPNHSREERILPSLYHPIERIKMVFR